MCVVLCCTVVTWAVEDKLVNYADFTSAINQGDGEKADQVGDVLIKELENTHEKDEGFKTYKSKLMAAEVLAGQMIDALGEATSLQTSQMAEDLFLRDSNRVNTKKKLFSGLPPAKQFYDTSLSQFSSPITINNLADEEKVFLSQYYDHKLRTLTNNIANAGQALAIAEPTFKGTHNYTLVLSLLHVSESQPININVLPKWMQTPEQLKIVSDVCLLDFGLAFQAMAVAKEIPAISKEPFSEVEFYKSAAKKCGKERASIAVKCLQMAINITPEQKLDVIIDLNFDIVQLWLDSENFALAAGHAKKIMDSYPDHENYSKAVFLHYYALSRNNNANAIIADIDNSIKDKRCEAYCAKLLYIKWWALRRSSEQDASLIALEHEILKKYGENPIVAPILLSQATDCLARQDYGNARQVLGNLVDKFPASKAAVQAKEILAKSDQVKVQ